MNNNEKTKQTMRVVISFADGNFRVLQYENLMNRQFNVTYNCHNLLTIDDVKFVEYYANSIKITISNYKSYSFELKDVTTFEVTREN